VQGAITEDHVLVVPVDHYPSAASLSPAAYTETERYLTALRALYAADGKQLVAFERHLALRNKVLMRWSTGAVISSSLSQQELPAEA
jgi:hypothetical protein